MNHKNASAEIISQIIEITNQLSNDEFKYPIPVLSGNTYGKHVRHIIEFYNCLLTGFENGVVDYDSRSHNTLTENNKLIATAELENILKNISNLENKQMLLKVDYSQTGYFSHIQTSFDRELVYNLEHAIHHMALMKIAVQSICPNIILPENFGIAYSTINFQSAKCAQ